MPDDAQQADLDRIKSGGLPLAAVQRLSEQADRFGTANEFFTSDLSVAELALTHDCGYEPLGQVMGSCVYNVGWQSQNFGWSGYQSREMETLTNAYSEARRLAFDRLRQEAKLLRADGVVGVRLLRKGDTSLSGGMVEFLALGTAVRQSLAPPKQGEPFVSNLSGQEHWALRSAGFKPLGFVYGNCSYCQYPDRQPGSFSVLGRNIEFTALTQGVYTARALAANRSDAEARHLRAHGVIGTTVEFDMEPVRPDKQPMFYLLHFCVFGTAIAPDPDVESLAFDVPFVVSLGGNA